MQSRTVYLTREQQDWLNRQSHSTGIPAAELIRRAIERARQGGLAAHGDVASIAASPHLGEAPTR